jgi:hypothetical protein
MNFNVVVDTSSFIWDNNDFENRKYEYSIMMLSVVTFLNKMQEIKPPIIIRNELLQEIFKEFPFDKIPNEHYDFTNLVLSFLTDLNDRIQIEPIDLSVQSSPNIIKPYYNITTKEEIKYILTHIHSTKNASNVYFTFHCIWNHENQLTTNIGNVDTFECETIITDKKYGSDNGLDVFLNKFKRKFEHHEEKHHPGLKPGGYVARLSCYKPNDNTPQTYLDTAILDGKNYYNYDSEHKVFIVFRNTQGNIYHAHDEENRNNIPPKVLKHFSK